MTFFEIILINSFLVFLFMSLLWLLAMKWNNVGVVDIGWTLCFPLCALVGSFFGQGDETKKIVLLILIVCWSLRLAFYLIQRFDKNVEDPRYTRIKKNLGGQSINLKMFGMFIFQGIIVLFLSIPFVVLFAFGNASWSFMELLGIFVWMIGWIGESLADRQMLKFKDEHKGSSQVCNIGLWRYSRHPNYFFEWMIWIGFSLFILPTFYGWVSLISVAFMFYVLRFYSGVPLSEQQALKTKGEAYKQYQLRTSIFFPWFPR